MCALFFDHLKGGCGSLTTLSLINDLNEALVNSCKLYAALGIDFTDSSCVIFDLQYVNQAADAYNNAAKKRPRAGYETSFAEFKGMQGKDLE